MIGCGLGEAYGVGYGRPAWPMLLPEVDFIPIGPWNTDGLVVIPPLATPRGLEYFRGLIDARFPFVFAGDRESGPAVVVDNTGGIRKSVEHLYLHGHRRIAFISGRDPGNEGDGRIRLRAFSTSVRELGLQFDEGLVEQGFHTRVGSRRAVEKLLARGGNFTALIASNDESALGAMDALLDAGLAIPDDVAVIGFDDRLEGRAYIPPLTSVHFPMFEMGYQSVVLVKRFIDQGSNPQEMIAIPTHLVVRDSCGCTMAQSDSNQATLAEDALIEVRSVEYLGEPISAYQNIALRMAAEVFNESSRMSRHDVNTHCENLVEAFRTAIESQKPDEFFRELAHVLANANEQGDSQLYAWQVAITELRNAIGFLSAGESSRLTQAEIEDLFNQARMQINIAARGNISRLRLRYTSTTEQIGQMMTHFISANDEAEIYRILSKGLPAIGIAHAAISFYREDQGDTFAFCELQAPLDFTGEKVFRSRQFPPSGLYDAGHPFSLMLLPIKSGDRLEGFCAFEGGSLEICAVILSQLMAALKSVALYKQAVAGRQLAEEANRLKSHFLSVVSHELRTPLNLISGLSDMLLRRGQPDEVECKVPREDLERIYISAQHLDGLIRDVLDLGQSDIGQLRLMMEPLEFRELLFEISKVANSLAAEKGLQFHAEIAAQIPRVLGDRTRLRQVLLNLINNAIKFTAHGSILLTALMEEGYVRVSIVDTGLGIPPEEQNIIFDEFRQSQRTAVRGFGGLGLGLAICRRLVEAHGGEIGVCSSGEEGMGSNFYFTIPLLPLTDLDRLAEPPQVAGERILLLAKDLSGAEMLKTNLAGRGMNVTIRVIEEDPDWLSWLVLEPPDAVVLDLSLTSESGWEILKTLKETFSTQHIPVFFYTLQPDQNAGALLEMNYLTKPLEPSSLTQALSGMGIDPGKREEGNGYILVVDDDPATVSFHKRMIEEQFSAFHVQAAANGLQALDLIRRERPVLVLLDLMMPEMDGFAVLDQMRAEDLTRNVPVIVISGQDLTAEEMERLNQGAASILTKGMFTTRETLAQVAETLERRRRAGSEVQRIVFKAISYIHVHYAEDVTRQMIASHVGLSERHLTRCFDQVVGLAPMVYLNRYRVRQARKLLEEGKRGITEVALAVGFSTSSYFTRVFRDEVGISPRAYLRSKCGPDEN